MPLPLAALAPYAIPAIGAGIGGLLGMLRGRGSQRAQQPQIQPQIMNQPGVRTIPGPEGTQFTQFQRTTPQQQQLLDLLSQQAQTQLGAPQQRFDFAPIEAEARRGFGERTIPGIAERFTGMGSALRGSGFQEALGQAGAGLESQLAAMRQQAGVQQQQLGQSQMQMLLSALLAPQAETFVTPGAPSGLGQVLGGLGGGLGQAIGAFGPLLASQYFGGGQQQPFQSPIQQ